MFASLAVLALVAFRPSTAAAQESGSPMQRAMQRARAMAREEAEKKKKKRTPKKPAKPSPPAPSAATPSPPSPPPPVAAEEKPSDAAATAQARTSALEAQLAEISDRVFRSRSKILLLEETVTGGDLSSASRAVIYHRNEMGPSFVLESVSYALDGAPIFTQTDATGEIDRRDEFEVFHGKLVPGEHQVAVRLVYRGHGYGVFSYLEGYRFKVSSSHSFTAEPGKVTTLKVVGFEKGGVVTDVKDRPAVRYDVEVAKEGPLRGSPTQAAEAK